MGGKKPLRRPLWPPTRATASNYYPLGLDGAGGAAKPLLRAPKKPAPLHGRLPAFSGAVDAFERARKCFLEWRYFFSIILSEFLKNRVALHKADQKFKYYEQEIAKATRTNTALRKKELVDSLVNEIKLQATTALKQEIVRKTNEKLRRVIVDDYVEIESIDRYIKLKGRDGASEGQTLSIAYCFLGTLFEDSELEFPFIIDSPTGKMDFEKRQAVADIIPLVFNQMIAFVQSAEVERFADRFYANPDSQYLTVVASPQDQAVVVYEGIDFFDSYQREHKGDEK